MAFTATMQWDVRTGGSNSNGGGFDSALSGTDRSVQDAAYITFTDLVIDGTTNTKCTSAAHPFDSTSPGNVINITSGSGFTVQRVLILSVAAGVATCDKSLGTLGSTGGNGKLGGGLLTIATAITLLISGNTIHVQSGTYTHTAATAIPVANLVIRGYATAHNDYGTKPLITTATNSVDLFTTSSGGPGTQTWDNLSLSNTASTSGNGIVQLTSHGSTQYWIVRRCLMDGFSNAINSDNVGAHFDVSNIWLEETEIKNSTTIGVVANTGIVAIDDCWIHNSGTQGVETASTIFIDRSIISANGGKGVNGSGGSGGIRVTNSSIANNTGEGIFPASSAVYVSLRNSIFYGNLANKNIMLTNPSTAANYAMSRSNAYGAVTNWTAAQGDVTLTADPFTSSTDFTLNSTAGGGAACKGAGTQR